MRIVSVLIGIGWLGLTFVSGCSDSDPSALDGSCTGPNQFLYEDEQCGGPSPDGGTSSSGCQPVGDGRCYLRCRTDDDCTDSARPFCRTIGLFSGFDFICTDSARICQASSEEDVCPQ